MEKLPVFSILLSVFCFTAGLAQRPTFSATQNWLDNVSHSTCMQRSKEALQMNNFSVTPQADKVSYLGENADWYAFLTCQSCGDKTITTIVLSTSKSVAAANELREQMLYYIATGKTQTGGSAAPVNLWLDKSNFPATEKITVHFANMPGNATDWVTLVEKGKANGQYGAWKYTEGKKSGSMVFDPLPAGEYEARAYFNNGYNVEKRVYFSVSGSGSTGTGTSPGGGGGGGGGGGTPVTGSRLKLNKGTFIEGEKIIVTYFNLPGNQQDWIYLAEAGKPDNSYGQWFYTEGKQSGTMDFNGLAPGKYEVRLAYQGSYTVEDRLVFSVISNPGGDFILRTEKTTFNQNETIPVEFSYSQEAGNDWVAICKSGSADNDFGQWFYTGILKSGVLTFNALPAGDYEIRYYLRGGYEVKKRLAVKVR